MPWAVAGPARAASAAARAAVVNFDPGTFVVSLLNAIALSVRQHLLVMGAQRIPAVLRQILE